MPANEKLARRVRTALASLGTVAEKRMFGGLAFMVDGKMCVTVGADRIMCRIDPALHETVLTRPECAPVVMRGREMRGYVRVAESALTSATALDGWIRLALEYNPRIPKRA